MKKKFGTVAVVGAYNGVMMEEDFSKIHEVFDFYWPGIMTAGIASKGDAISKLIGDAVQGIKALPEVNGENYEQVAKLALEKFGPEIELEVPEGAGSFSPLSFELESIAKARASKE